MLRNSSALALTGRYFPAIIISFFLLSSCEKQEQVAEEKNKEIVETYFNKVWNNGNIDVLDDLLSADYVNHTPSTANPPKGPDGLKPIVFAIRRAFPDLHYEIKDLIATKDKVVARVIMSGTQTDSLFGLPPTGLKVVVNQINIEKIEDGKIAEHWRVTDELTMMKQQGFIE
jgi:steroid delta-isomerase-like uncharacterized protein